MDSNGVMLADGSVADGFVNHYESFLGQPGHTSEFNMDGLFLNTLEARAALNMVRAVTVQEVKEAIFSMENDKSPGPDALIPKVSTPTRTNDYRLISCCNVLFKVISKIISNRIKSLHGHFLGKRGLQHGDPLSPYLFTLIMEVLTLMLQRRVRNSDLFTYHRYCSKMELINLCFADDLFLFAHGDVNSARVIMDMLDEFKLASGLTPSLPKSTDYFCNVLNHTKISILHVLPFEEGRLPVKYLG
ncbi:reverse transcriptase domain-containing protein, partial [Tanacetum coccineum]